jgi:hypothetical protein
MPDDADSTEYAKVALADTEGHEGILREPERSEVLQLARSLA